MPFLVLGNKIDIPSAASEDEMRYALGLANATTGKGKVDLKDSNIRPAEIFMCSVVRRMGYGAHARVCVGGVRACVRACAQCEPTLPPALPPTRATSPSPPPGSPSHPMQARASAGCLSTSSEAGGAARGRTLPPPPHTLDDSPRGSSSSSSSRAPAPRVAAGIGHAHNPRARLSLSPPPLFHLLL